MDADITEAELWHRCESALAAANVAGDNARASKQIQREQWRVAGAELSAIRELYQSNDGAFGAACAARGLNLTPQERSDLMWWSHLTDEQRTLVNESDASSIHTLVDACRTKVRLAESAKRAERDAAARSAASPAAPPTPPPPATSPPPPPPPPPPPSSCSQSDESEPDECDWWGEGEKPWLNDWRLVAMFDGGVFDDLEDEIEAVDLIGMLHVVLERPIWDEHTNNLVRTEYHDPDDVSEALSWLEEARGEGESLADAARGLLFGDDDEDDQPVDPDERRIVRVRTETAWTLDRLCNHNPNEWGTAVEKLIDFFEKNGGSYEALNGGPTVAESLRERGKEAPQPDRSGAANFGDLHAAARASADHTVRTHQTQ